ncbi:MAG: DUF4188 domain-containing protein [Pseudomonadota bacterium]
MLMASFIFTETDLDETFFTLDALILEAAEATPGYIGKENWVSQDGGTRNSVYYWRDQKALAQFARHPKHLEAKRQYEKWYGGFHVVISEIKKSYGDGALAHLTPNDRLRRAS